MHGLGSTVTPVSNTYTLNAVGDRTQVVDGSGTTTYAYDNLHRLTSVTYPGPTTDTYTYDANGNRLTKNATTPLAQTVAGVQALPRTGSGDGGEGASWAMVIAGVALFGAGLLALRQAQDRPLRRSGT